MRRPLLSTALLALSSGCAAVSLHQDGPVGPSLQAVQAPLPPSVREHDVVGLGCSDLAGPPVSVEYVVSDATAGTIEGARVGFYDWPTQQWVVVGVTDARGRATVDLPRPGRVALLDGTGKGVCVKASDDGSPKYDVVAGRVTTLPVEVVGPDGAVLDDVSVALGILKASDRHDLNMGRMFPLRADGLGQVQVRPRARYQVATSHPTFAVECVGLASQGDCAEPGIAEDRDILTIPGTRPDGDTVVVRLGDHGHIGGQAVSIETGRPIEGARFELLGTWKRWSDADGRWSAPLLPDTEGMPTLKVPGHTSASLGFFFRSPPAHLAPLAGELAPPTFTRTFHQTVRLVHLEGWDVHQNAFPSCMPADVEHGFRADPPSIPGQGILVACPATGPARIRFSDGEGAHQHTVSRWTVDADTTHFTGPYPAEER
jgi:hypothetical protein